jgi:phosphatidylcholine synthase
MSLRTWAAWGVHLYTGIGAPLALVGLIASGQGWFGVAFACMAVATFIDATDGQLARRVNVKQVLPQFDGARLDDIVDYMNYVLVPVVVAYHSGLLPPGLWGLAIASAPLIASAYGFAQSDAKAVDTSSNYFFTGFPSYWNIVVFYLYAFGMPVFLNVAILLTFSVLVFVPIRYLYPSRSTIARGTTYVLGAAWGVIMVALLLQFPRPSLVLAVLSLFFPIYYVGLSLYVHFNPSALERRWVIGQR